MSVFKPELCEECATLYKYNRRLKEIATLRKQLDDAEVTIVALCAESKSIRDERDTLQHKFNIAMDALRLCAIPYPYPHDRKQCDMAFDAITEIEKSRGER